MANIQRGEIGVHYEGREYIFRPSFARLDELAQDYDLKELWSDIQTAKRGEQEKCATIILSYLFTGTEDELDTLIGYTMPINGWPVYVPGAIPRDEQCILAFSLLRNGMNGTRNIGQIKKSESNASKKFNAYDYVWSAVRNLGMTREEAENMTMAEFQHALMIAFPGQFVDWDEKNSEVEDFLADIERRRSLING